MIGWRWPALVLLVPVVAVCALAQLATGSSLSPVDTAAALFGGDGHAYSVIVELRVPRVLVALCAGACLGVAGALLQCVLRNPLAAPEITGVGSGAVLGAVSASVAGGVAATAPFMAAAALVGGVVGGGVLWVLASRLGGDAMRLAVVGVVVSAVLAGLTLVLLTARPQLAGAVTRWLLGSLVGRTWEHLAPLWPVLTVVLVASVAIAGVLDVVAVDDDHALAVGLAVAPWRNVVLALAALATSAAVAAVGATAFIGLLAPHAARWLTGAAHRFLVPAAALIGAGVLALADTAAQLVTTAVGRAEAGLPAGAVTALAGAAVLIALARRSSSSITGGAE
ncbi:iron complex transport system permease protein [Lentzea atacamensis]|uniref:Iron complex transport system permease protein n=1 Tax=Lentzea atacamensis TaxID=531938 RepID=A0A316I3H5_9PSEU|nr:iron ABC transporter permease [Lentzea atacamensis]PWK86940.1 iron complex transport system permease protein [Lentzea atacamensis]